MKQWIMSALFGLFLLSWLVPGNAQNFNPTPSTGQDYFTAIIDQDPNIRTYASLVTSAHVDTIPKWVGQGRMNDALSDLRYALDRFPNHPKALQELSMVAQLVKQPSLANNYFQRAITLYPQYAITRAQYGLFLVSIDKVDDGIERFKQATSIDPKLSLAYVGLARAYEKKHDLGRAREAANKAREFGSTAKLP